MNTDIARYVRTIRHLKPVQIYGRIQHRIAKPRIESRATPRLQLGTAHWVQPIERAGFMTGPTTIRLLNREGEIATAGHWNEPSQDKLWLYNLHYFDELNARSDATRLSWQNNLVARWVAENPVGQGNGWEPYPLSLRIVNWIKWALGGVELESEWCESLGVQVRYLAQRIEWHLLGNHLLANAKALVFAGVCFTGNEADDWLHSGLAIYQRELKEQVLEDGGHFELSPMYHVIVLEDLLDVINLMRAHGFEAEPAVSAFCAAIEKMLCWLEAMVHPDGEVSFFNDTAFGIAAEPLAIRSYAGRLGFGGSAANAQRLLNLPASGYVRMARGRACAILDVASVGPDYLPGHAHADTLSFELSVDDQRLIVNGGTSVYGMCDQRQFERSTAAHSTVEINGESSSEVWGGFRVGRRAQILSVKIADDASETSVSAAHDGYHHLPGKPVHRRTWAMDEANLTVIDRIEGDYCDAIARFHFGEAVEVRADAEGGDLVLPNKTKITFTSSAPARTVASHWHPQFGVTVPTKMIEVPIVNHRLTVQFGWT